MMNTTTTITTQSNVVGNKAARSCDSCLSKRATWYCGADDAFLCQSCDTTVHSANQLARRHERVRLEKPLSSSLIWSQGITKKPRTPRSRKRLQKQDEDSKVEAVLVPEFRSEEIFSPNIDQNEEQYTVPVLDLFGGEISNGFFENEDNQHMIVGKDSEEEFDLDSLLNDHHEVSTMNLFDPEFMEKDVELEDYLVGVKIEDDSNKGCLKTEQENQQDVTVTDFYCNNNSVGLEMEMEMGRGESSNWDFEGGRDVDFYSNSLGLEMTRQSSNWDFEDYSSSPEEEEKRRINLKLNHEAIICAWDRGNSPWMNGIKPEFNLEDDCWPHFMGSGCTNMDDDSNGGNSKSGWPGSGSGSGSGSGRFDEEREARVLRYKEKRRTRLFAKKIRYEVRKLNAEKRPRMKGRFVKRNAVAASSSLPCYIQMNT